MADKIRVNGSQISWGSIVAKVSGVELYGFTAINYGDSRAREKARGLGKHMAPRGRSRGEYDTEDVKLTGYVTSVQALRDQLSLEQGNDGYGDTEFSLLVQYIEDDETPIQVEILGCMWSKNGAQHASGNGPLTEDVELSCMAIRRNGKVLFQSREGSPY